MPRISLTDATIRALKPTGKQETYWCNLTPNFALRMSQKGGKSFFVMLGRERKRVHLGKYPATPLKHAREKARALLLNPAARPERQDACVKRSMPTSSQRSSPTTNRDQRTAVRSPSFATRANFADRPVISITTRDLSTLFSRLSHTPSEANHLYKVLAAFFRHAVQHGVVVASPITFPKPYKEVSRERVLTDAELVAVYRAASGDGTSVRLHGPAVHPLRVSHRRSRRHEVELHHEGLHHDPGRGVQDRQGAHLAEPHRRESCSDPKVVRVPFPFAPRHALNIVQLLQAPSR